MKEQQGLNFEFVFVFDTGKITSGGVEMQTAVDYVTGILLDDPCNLLLEIINDWLGKTPKVAEDMVRLLEITRNFLKNQFISHARKRDGFCTHSYCHALAKPDVYAEAYFSDDNSNTEASSSDDSDYIDFSDDESDVPEHRPRHSENDSDSDDDSEAPEIGPMHSCYCPDDNDSDDDLDVSELQARHPPTHLSESDVEVTGAAATSVADPPECHACKFPFYFLEELQGKVKDSFYKRTDRVGRETAGRSELLRDESAGSSCTSTKDESASQSEESISEADEDPAESVRLLYETVGWDNKLKDVLGVIDSIEDKFRRFMAHKHRTACQQDEIQRCDHDMREEAKLNGGNGTILGIIGDFKMNWNAMGNKETTQQHYGKRGIPWHGFLGVYYRYIPESDSFERVVIKVDQILEGDAFKNGAAVLSLLECFLCQVEKEFPFLRKAIFQSDNAGNYHKKDLVLGIAFLNLKRGGRIRVTRFIHTETQDGKSLLDAHFARGTKQVIKYIKTCPSVETKQVAAPVELAKALAWNGGIQNSCVQHVKVNRNHMDDFDQFLEKCSDKALEFFSRSNDIFYLAESNSSEYNVTDPSSWESVSILIRAFAFSGIGKGADFSCDCGKGTFTYEGESGWSDDDGFCMDTLEDDDVDCIESHMMGCNDDDEKDILNDLSALFEEDIHQWKRQTFGDAEDLPVPHEASFNSQNMFSRAEILGASPFGKIEGKLEMNDNSSSKFEKPEEQGEGTKSRAALPRALNLVSVLVANNCIEIRSGKDDNLSEYGLTKGFDLDKSHFRKGWGRRPLAGKLYGESHIKEFYDEIYEWVAAGSRDKSEKKNPRQMYLELRRKYARYSVPMESEIRVLIDSVLKSLEPERTKKPQKKKKEEKKEKKERIPECLEDQYKTVSGEMKKKVRQKGWENMKPMIIFNRIVYEKQLLGKVSTRAGLKTVAGLHESDIKCLSSECRKEFSSWKSARKKK
jgi:hypothetical protein